jgi:hypothetical protein
MSRSITIANVACRERSGHGKPTNVGIRSQLDGHRQQRGTRRAGIGCAHSDSLIS